MNELYGKYDWIGGDDPLRVPAQPENAPIIPHDTAYMYLA